MNLKIKKFDTCYTFVLRWFDILHEYIDTESDEFLKLFDLKKFDDNLQNNDVIVFTTDNYIFANTELLNFIPISNKFTDGLHFCIFYNNLIYDVSFINGINYIRVRHFKHINFSSDCVRVIKYEDICKILK
jgi:hypothetical protein